MGGIIYAVRLIGEGFKIMRNKNNIRKNAKTYQKWLDARDGFDATANDGLSDSKSPYYVRPLPLVLSDLYERLENLYWEGYFKGRQKQILKLLLEGETNQTIIAKRLNMRQSNVSIELQKIREKISQNII